MTHTKPLELCNNFISGKASLKRAHVLAKIEPFSGEPKVLVEKAMNPNVFSSIQAKVLGVMLDNSMRFPTSGEVIKPYRVSHTAALQLV